MQLKSLELNGFKSFANKAVLEFPRGITAIVGPNGSGKSNVIDAIRWILGERDAKNLRGEKIENLIFAGTPKRSRAAMAQVSLNFDNKGDDGFAETSVVRRVARDGVSQYLHNKSEVRLKDIIDFFAKARLGTKGLTIINQGSSDLFVRATPEERRIMIEEVLGLREFQIKKSDAERKLNNTNINLEKVKAMIAEVLPRLRMLKRQTAKWEKREQIEAELKGLENDYFAFKLGEIGNEKRKLEPVSVELNQAIAQKNGELKVLESEVKKLEEKSAKGNFEEIKNRKAELSGKHFKIQKELSRLEAKIEILSQREEKKDSEIVFQSHELLDLINEVKKSLGDVLTLRQEEIISGVKAIIGKIDLFFRTEKIEKEDFHFEQKQKEISELEKIKQDLFKDISLIEEGLKQIEKTESEIASGLQDFNKHFQQAFETMDAKREELRALENQRQKAIFEREKLDMKLVDLENQIEQIGRHTNEFIISINQRDNQHESALIEAERKMFRLRAELASIGEIDEALIKEAQETEAHYNFLSGQIADLEKAFEDLKILIKELKEKIHNEFLNSFRAINEKFDHFFRLMFKGGHAKLKVKSQKFHAYRQAGKVKSNNGEDENSEVKEVEEDEEQEEKIGIEIDLNLPGKKISGLEVLSGGEKSLVSIAALFALVSVSPPPFLVLDEIDAPLDEKNSQMFANLIRDFSGDTQFVIVTHNRAVMEVANVLYGVTMNEDGTSKLLSIKLDTKI